MKNFKTFYEAQTASRHKEIIQPLPNPTFQPYQIKFYYVSATKTILRRNARYTEQ